MSPVANSPWRKSLAAFFGLLLFASVSNAQSVWMGTSSASWTDAANWSAGVPVSGGTAQFTGTSPNVSISLNGATQPINTISFTGSPASYNLGVTAGDAFAVDAGGAISMAAGVTNPQTISAAISAAGAITITNAAASNSLTLGVAGSSTPLTVPSGSVLTLSVGAAGATIVNNYSIQGGGGVTLPASTTGVIVFNGQSTYAGTTDQLSSNAVTIQIGSSTDTASNSTFTKGPFGTGILKFDNTSNSPVQAVGADQTIANQITMAFGFTTTSASTPHSLSFTGPMSLIANGRTITNNMAAGTTLTLGSASAPSTISLSTGSAQNLAIAGSGAYVINDTIQDNAVPPATPNTVGYAGTGSVALNAQNTYTGGTTLSGAGPQIKIGVSSLLSGTTITSGPFGLGTITMNSGTPAILEPAGADRTVANPFTLTNGFFAGNVAGDPHNLTLSGNLTLGATARTSTNNMVGGVSLALGSAPNSATFSLGATMTFQTQTAGGGNTIINDTVTGAGGLAAQNNVILNLNGNNTYAGPTSAKSGSIVRFNGANTGTGAITANGTGAVGSGGTVGGNGSVAGTVTISTNTLASEGGIVYPGPGGSTVGTLNVASMVWNPLGRYVFLHSATDPTVGSGVNNLISGSGTLDLTNLSGGGNQFDINLAPTNFSPTPTQMTYTIANFLGGVTGFNSITGNPYPTNTDISSLFTMSGAFGSTGTPFAMVVAGTGGPSAQAIQISFTPVPEPIFLLAACGGLTALAAWRRSRRSSSTK